MRAAGHESSVLRSRSENEGTMLSFEADRSDHVESLNVFVQFQQGDHHVNEIPCILFLLEVSKLLYPTAIS